jgi:hypothetical protein
MFDSITSVVGSSLGAGVNSIVGSVTSSVNSVTSSVFGGINDAITSAQTLIGGPPPFSGGLQRPVSLDKMLMEKSVTSPLLYHFNRYLWGLNDFTPDINGYTLIFMQPPHLSGLNNDIFMRYLSKAFGFLALDFTPPQTNVNISEVAGGGAAIPFAADVGIHGGQLNISFIDTSRLHVFHYHKLWVNYMRDVIKGVISPTQRYIESGEIDYLTSAYVIRFKPISPGFVLDDIVYVGKAVGIFPLNLPDKEVIGRRDSNELTVLPISYACTEYRQVSSYDPSDPSSWIWPEFLSVFAGDFLTNSFTGFMSDILGGVGGPLTDIGASLAGGIVNNIASGASAASGFAGFVSDTFG